MNTRAYIWDLDGTLIDSYGVIVGSIIDTMKEFGLTLEYKKIHEYVIKYSVNDCLIAMAAKTGYSFQQIRATYGLISGARNFDVGLIPNAREVLYALTLKGARHFVYTHRGVTTDAILQNFYMRDSFVEVVNSQYGFARKPSPDAINYLVNKYHLDKENTFYVGDRKIDMECAQNSGVKGILYLEPNGVGEKSGFETYVVSNLMDITKL